MDTWQAVVSRNALIYAAGGLSVFGGRPLSAGGPSPYKENQHPDGPTAAVSRLRPLAIIFFRRT